MIGGIASGMIFVGSIVDGSGLKTFSRHAANTFELSSLLSAHSPVCVL